MGRRKINVKEKKSAGTDVEARKGSRKHQQPRSSMGSSDPSSLPSLSSSKRPATKKSRGRPAKRGKSSVIEPDTEEGVPDIEVDPAMLGVGAQQILEAPRLPPPLIGTIQGARKTIVDRFLERQTSILSRKQRLELMERHDRIILASTQAVLGNQNPMIDAVRSLMERQAKHLMEQEEELMKILEVAASGFQSLKEMRRERKRLEKEKKESRKKKGDTRVNHPPNAFILFRKKAIVEYKKRHKKVQLGEMSKALSLQWSQLGEGGRAPYVKMYEESMIKWERQKNMTPAERAADDARQGKTEEGDEADDSGDHSDDDDSDDDDSDDDDSDDEDQADGSIDSSSSSSSSGPPDSSSQSSQESKGGKRIQEILL